MNKIIIFAGIFFASRFVFSYGNEALLIKKILFAYQYYSVSRGLYSVSKEAAAKYSLEPCLRPPQSSQPPFLHHLYWWEQNRGNYGILNAYALKYGLKAYTPFPSDLLQVEGIPIAESFAAFYERYIQSIHRHSDWHYKTHNCEYIQEDISVIERVLQDTSNDKNILFVGFDATIPTEGSRIFHDTPSYRHSLFWSDSNNGTILNYNRIKSCFCQSQALLDMGLANFFDYIIIGGQTVEYLNLETWLSLRHFLKEGGCIVYPEMPWFYWGGEILNHLFNLSIDDTCEFELQRHDNQNDSTLLEIKAFAKFNNQPSHGEFCYGDPDKPYVIYSHKKIVR